MQKGKNRTILTWILTISIVVGMLPFSTVSLATEINTDVGITETYWGNISGNILNGGLVANYNGEDYVIENDRQNNIFKNGVLISPDTCTYINILDGYIYYIASMDYHMEIVRCGLNGEDRTVLYSEYEVFLSNLFVSKDALYFLESGERIFRLSNDDSIEIIFIDENILDFVFLDSNTVVLSNYDEMAVFSGVEQSERSLFVIDGDVKTLISGNIASYDVRNNTIYYSDIAHDTIYSLDYTSGEKSIFLADWAADSIICDDALYLLSSNDHKLYSVDFMSMDVSCMSDQQLRLINRGNSFYTFPFSDDTNTSMLEDSREIVLFAESTWLWPTSGKNFSSAFGYRTFDKKHHNGIDIGKRGNPVYATRSGTVYSTGNKCLLDSKYPHPSCACSGNGNYIVIDHGNGVFSHYLHLIKDSYTVRVGYKVSQGQQIGQVGSSGSSTGAHLHFARSQPRGTYQNTNPRNYVALGIKASDVESTDGYKGGYFAAAINYVLTPILAAPPTIPTISVENYVGGKKVTLSAQSGTTIYYTTNGNDPSTSSSKYSAPFNITSGTVTVKTLAQRSTYIISAISSRSVEVKKLATPKVVASLNSSGTLITITQADSAEIRYTTNGSAPNASSTKYNGPFQVTSNATIRAVAVKSGFANSDISSPPVDVVAVAPTAPTGVTANSLKIAVGGGLEVKWAKVSNAVSYEARLYKNGSVVDKQTTDGLIAGFVLPVVGVYEVKIVAKNHIGTSAESLSVSVEAMPPCKVTFFDWDGNVITEIEVKYGGKLGDLIDKVPPPLEREDRVFLEWSIGLGTEIRENKNVIGNWRVATYTIRFYDTNGTRLLAAHPNVEYGSSVVPPSGYAIDSGFVFAGWQTRPGSKGTSYTFVSGAMDLVATQVWENPSLPIVVEIDKAERIENGDGYRIEVSITHAHTNYSQGKIVAMLKTAEGKMIESRYSDFTLRPETPGVKRKETITINTSKRATTVEVVAIGFEGSTTRGTLSELVSSIIVLGKNWGQWSYEKNGGEWSVQYPEVKEGRQIASKVQIRERRRETNTSTTSNTMAGWTRYDTTSVVGNWTAWSRSQPASKADREIDKKTTPATYKTQYNYWGYKNSNGITHFCRGAGKYVYGTTFSKIESGWRDTTMTSTTISTQTCSGGLYAGTSNACHHTGRINVSVKYSSSPSYFWRDSRTVIKDAAYDEYRYRDTTHTYYFYKFGDWSAWRDRDPVAGASMFARDIVVQSEPPVPLIETESRTVYTFRDEAPLYDPGAETEDTSGETYRINGNLGTSEDFSGRKATILVYRKTNSDPLEEHIQYVGQLTISADNSYYYEFKPKNEPDANTGDFVVTLALEGASRVRDVLIIEADKPEYSVTFKADDVVLSSQMVKEGDAAVVPNAPYKEGYTFVGWNGSPVNVHWDITLEAIYIPSKHMVVLVDFAGETVDMETRDHGDPLGIQPPPLIEGKEFKGWYVLDGSERKAVDADTAVTGNMLIIADWVSIVYTVVFVDQDGEAVSTQQVAHGEAAKIPAPLTFGDMVFAGWSTGVNWWYVTDNVTVQPLFLYSFTTEIPEIYSEADSEDDEDDEDDFDNVFYIKSSTQNATIYYSVESLSDALAKSVYEDEGFESIFLPNVYTDDEPILITEDVRITAIAVAEGLNESEIIVVDLYYVNPTPGVSYEEPGLYTGFASARPGDTVVIPVYLSDVEGVVASLASLTYEYDRSVLTRITGSSAGISGSADTENILKLLSVASDGDEDNSILLTTLRFTVAASAQPEYYQIEITPNNARDGDGNLIHVSSTTAYIVVTPDGDGYTISGVVRTYNPAKTTTLRLLQDGVQQDITTIQAPTGTGQQDQDFAFNGVLPGIYTLEITKAGHTKLTLENLIVGDADVDLRGSTNSAVSVITLLCGDINSDGVINQLDLNLLWLPANYNKSVAGGANELCDLNGDGVVNQLDLNILWLPANYNKGAIIIE